MTTNQNFLDCETSFDRSSPDHWPTPKKGISWEQNQRKTASPSLELWLPATLLSCPMLGFKWKVQLCSIGVLPACKEFWLQPYEDAMMPADVPACEGWKEGRGEQTKQLCVRLQCSTQWTMCGGRGRFNLLIVATKCKLTANCASLTSVLFASIGWLLNFCISCNAISVMVSLRVTVHCKPASRPQLHTCIAASWSTLAHCTHSSSMLGPVLCPIDLDHAWGSVTWTKPPAKSRRWCET